jgi:hypothetical protein
MPFRVYDGEAAITEPRLYDRRQDRDQKPFASSKDGPVYSGPERRHHRKRRSFPLEGETAMESSGRGRGG